MSLFEDPEVGAASEPTFSVTELADRIGNALRAAFRDEVWVRGEIRCPVATELGPRLLHAHRAGAGTTRGACLGVMLSSRTPSAR